DQFDSSIVFAPAWVSSEGAIDASGFFEVGDQPAGTIIVTATDATSGLEALATVTISSGVGVEEEDPDELPKEYALFQNYPNPFNPTTTIGYSIPIAQRVRLDVYDVLGRRVRTLVDESLSAGRFQVRFDAGTLSSGVYFYRMTAGGFAEVRSLVLVR
ncbi:MAG: hypothetical protein ACI84D_003845, partial [Thalassolituus oleivorans]